MSVKFSGQNFVHHTENHTWHKRHSTKVLHKDYWLLSLSQLILMTTPWVGDFINFNAIENLLFLKFIQRSGEQVHKPSISSHSQQLFSPACQIPFNTNILSLRYVSNPLLGSRQVRWVSYDPPPREFIFFRDSHMLISFKVIKDIQKH